MRPAKLLKYTGEARLGEFCVVRGRDRSFVRRMEGTKSIVKVTSCVVSPCATLKENDDTGGTGVGIVMGNEERQVFVFAEIFDCSRRVNDVLAIERELYV